MRFIMKSIPRCSLGAFVSYPHKHGFRLFSCRSVGVNFRLLYINLSLVWKVSYVRGKFVCRNGVFPTCFTENSVTKIFVITVKGPEPAIQLPLVWETRMLPQHKQDTCGDRIFKLSPIHASFISDSLNLLNQWKFSSI